MGAWQANAQGAVIMREGWALDAHCCVVEMFMLTPDPDQGVADTDEMSVILICTFGADCPANHVVDNTKYSTKFGLTNTILFSPSEYQTRVKNNHWS